MRTSEFRAAMIAGSCAVLAACGHHASASMPDRAGAATVTGTVAYRERIALPPDAVVEVTLLDASLQDVAAKVIGTSTVLSNGKQVPLPFSVSYDPHRIEKNHLYTIRAVIKSAGQLLFTTDIVRGVITQSNPTAIDLVLVRVDPTVGASSVGLVGSSWVLEDLNGAGVVDDTHATLEFSANGRASGNGSCNRFFGTVEISGTSITFGAVGSTRMACPTAISLQEVKYFEALEAADHFTLDGSTLSIFGIRGGKPLRFTRASP